MDDSQKDISSSEEAQLIFEAARRLQAGDGVGEIVDGDHRDLSGGDAQPFPTERTASSRAESPAPTQSIASQPPTQSTHSSWTARTFESKQDIQDFATDYSGNPEIGQVIATALDGVGLPGIVRVEQGQCEGVELTFTSGIQCEVDHVASEGISDSKEVMLDDASVLILSDPPQAVAIGGALKWTVDDPRTGTANTNALSDHDLAQSILTSIPSGTPLLAVVASEAGLALAEKAIRQANGVAQSAVVRLSAGEEAKFLLQDIAIFTGGEILASSHDVRRWRAPGESFGCARRIVVSKDHLTILDGQGKPDEIKGRVHQIMTEIKITNSATKLAELHGRLGGFSGGAAIIQVGGSNEHETTTLISRVEHALAATRRALLGNPVPKILRVVLLWSDESEWKVTSNSDVSPGAHELTATIQELLSESPLKQAGKQAGRIDFEGPWSHSGQCVAQLTVDVESKASDGTGDLTLVVESTLNTVVLRSPSVTRVFWRLDELDSNREESIPWPSLVDIGFLTVADEWNSVEVRALRDG